MAIQDLVTTQIGPQTNFGFHLMSNDIGSLFTVSSRVVTYGAPMRFSPYEWEFQLLDSMIQNVASDYARTTDTLFVSAINTSSFGGVL